MSDNPADSLRRGLEAASRHHVFECQCITGEWHTAAAKATFDWLSALIAPIVEAARADERERIAKAIAARNLGYAADGYDQGWNDAMRTAAGEARGGV